MSLRRQTGVREGEDILPPFLGVGLVVTVSVRQDGVCVPKTRCT
jgi:hypothetical protein